MLNNQSTDKTAASNVTDMELSFVEVTAEDAKMSEATEKSKDILTMSVSPMHSSIGMNAQMNSTKVCVSIKASDLPEDYEANRMALDLVVALDVSGSMSGQKLRDCKSTLTAMLRPLGPKDRFGLTIFGSSAKTVLGSSFMTKDNKEYALKKIQSLNTSGCTNLSGGLSLAWQEMQMIDNPNMVRSVFLLTDGQANEGIVETEALVDMVKGFNKVGASESVSGSGNQRVPQTISLESPISLFCFGYGNGHNSDMLERIASATLGGAYYFVENDSDVSTAFGDAFGGLLSVVAQSAVLKLAVPPAATANGLEIVDVYHDEKIKRSDGSYTVSIGDFYAEESRDVLFEINLSKTSSFDVIPHAVISLSYMDVINKKMSELGPVECALKRPENTSEVSPSNTHVEAQWMRIHTVQELEAADKEAASGHQDMAKARLKNLCKYITESKAYDPNSALMAGMLSDVKAVISSMEQTYIGQGAYMGHTMKNRMVSLKKQRCMASSSAQSVTYVTKRKAKMRSDMTMSTISPQGTSSAVPESQNATASRRIMKKIPKKNFALFDPHFTSNV